MIGNYIQSCPIVSGGTGLLAPPTITITDSGSGAGAAAVAVMTGPLSTDTISYACAGRMALGRRRQPGGTSCPRQAGAAMSNWVGQLEGPTGKMVGFQIAATMPAGANIGYSPTAYPFSVYFTGKNKLKASDPWRPGFGSTALTLDANFYPSFWSANSWVQATFYGSNGSYTAAQSQGIWSVQYDDSFYTTGLGVPLLVSITTAGQGATLTPVANGPHTILPTATATFNSGTGKVTGFSISNAGSGLKAVLVTFSGGGGTFAAASATIVSGAVSTLNLLCGGQNYTSAPTVTLTPLVVSGTAVTAQWTLAFGAQNHGDFAYLYINIVSGSAVGAGGQFAQTVSNLWVFAPGNTTDRSKPLATDDNVVAALTNNGNGPGVMRFMDGLGGPFDANCIDVSDILNPNLYSWDAYFQWNSNYPTNPPNLATFSGTCTAGSATVTGIASTSALGVGSTIIGNGIPGIIYDFGDSNVNETKVTALTSTTITLSNEAQISGVQSLSVNPFPSGNIVFGFVRQYCTNPAQTGITWTPSGNLYSSENWANSGADSFGPYLTMTNGPQGLVDNGNYISQGPGTWGNGILELRSLIPHGIKTGAILGGFPNGASYTETGTTTSGSATVTGVTAAGTKATDWPTCHGIGHTSQRVCPLDQWHDHYVVGQRDC